MANFKCFRLLDLQEYYNNDGISYDENRSDGMFGAISSFPAEELPFSNSVIVVQDIPFKFPSKEDGYKNNIECFNQSIKVPSGKYSNLYVLGSCDNGSFEEKIELIYENYKYFVMVGLSDWLSDEPFYNEILACECSHSHLTDKDREYKTRMWVQQVSIIDDEHLVEIKLPDNPCYHIFAITLGCKIG